MSSKCCTNGSSCKPTDLTVLEEVRKRYAKVVTEADKGQGCCNNGQGSCFTAVTDSSYAEKLGYTQEDLNNSEGANIGMGCGNPVMFAKLNPGETVVDLGSGAGFDSFIAARKVGTSGKVIGVDMTHEMLKKARENVIKKNAANVDFRLGEIQNLPIADNTIDVIISNCVINHHAFCYTSASGQGVDLAESKESDKATTEKLVSAKFQLILNKTRPETGWTLDDKESVLAHLRTKDKKQYLLSTTTKIDEYLTYGETKDKRDFICVMRVDKFHLEKLSEIVVSRCPIVVNFNLNKSLETFMV